MSNRGIWWLVLSVFAGAASALYDKYAVAKMDPMFVQCWSNLFITVFMGIVLLARNIRGPRERFHWDWYLPLTAVLIVLSDAFYYFALSCDGAMLAVISLVRRSSIAVTFILGAIVFKENNVRSKIVPLMIMVAAMVMLVIFS